MKNISLKAKILLLSIFMIGSSVIVGGVASTFSQKTISSFHEVIDVELPTVVAVDNMSLAFRLINIELLRMNSNGATEASRAESKKSIQEQWAVFEENNKFYKKLSEHASNDEKQIYSDFIKEIEAAHEVYDKAIALYNKNPAEGSTEHAEISKLVATEFPVIADKIKGTTNKLIELQKNQIKSSAEAAFKAAERGTLFSALVTLICALFGLSVAFIFSTKLARQMNHVIDSISASSKEVAAASNQIAKSSDELSQASTEQATSLGQTAASLEEITAMIAKAAESATSTEKSSSVSQNKAEEGRRAVDQMLSSIEEISQSNEEIVNQVNHSNQQMSEIVRVIQEIGTKTKVINEIVFQTKLLSFNASVEAARAGEHGKGFAVVAEEVGNLAQMSGNAAKEISDMLDGSISKVESIVKESKSKIESLVDSGKQKVEIGIDVARQCSTVLDEIVSNVTQVTTLSLEISQASREQAQGVGEINKAMSQLDSATQQNSSTSEQTASAAAQLSGQASALKSAVEELVVVIRGGATHLPPSAQKPTVLAKNGYTPSPEAKHSEAKVNKKSTSTQLSKTESKKPANVIALKAKKKTKPEPVKDTEVASASPSEYKMVSGGDSLAPSRDSDGFDE